MKKSFCTLRQCLAGAALVATAISCAAAQAGEYLNGITWKKPAIVTPGATAADPPSDAIVLFDGTDLSHWKNGERWTIEEGDMIAGKGPVASKETFGDCHVHIEWSAPTPPKGKGQGR